MGYHGLSLVTQGTEIFLLIKQSNLSDVKVMIWTDGPATSNTVKYIGFDLDCKLTWNKTRLTPSKAAKVTSHLSSLMAKVVRPTGSICRLLMSVIHSILLYECEICVNALIPDRYRRHITAMQISGFHHVSSPYRTGDAHGRLR